MTQLMNDLVTAQPDSLFILAGLLLIAIGVVGSIKTYINPGRYGRIAALGIGCLLVVVGCVLYAKQPPANAAPAATTPAATPATTTPVATPAAAAPATATTPATVSADVTSTVCTFDAGPLSGATHELPRAKPHPIGYPCHDMKGNRGHIVAPNTPLTP